MRCDTRRLTIFVVLLILGFLFLLPTAGVLLSSVETRGEIAQGHLWVLPSRLYFGNFEAILMNPAIRQYLLNSLIVTVPGTIASTALGVLAGYVFAKLPFRGSEFVFLALVSGMFFPPQVILVPLFRLFAGWGMVNTLWPVFIINTALGIPICTLLMRNFFATVPTALREAAILEGANEWQILTKVVLPLSLPALAVLATLQFTWIWNDFLWPLIFTQSNSEHTIMVGLVDLKGQYSVAWGAQGAVSIIASLPTLGIFLFFQRFFIKGMAMGAVKG